MEQQPAKERQKHRPAQELSDGRQPPRLWSQERGEEPRSNLGACYQRSPPQESHEPGQRAHVRTVGENAMLPIGHADALDKEGMRAIQNDHQQGVPNQGRKVGSNKDRDEGATEAEIGQTARLRLALRPSI
jgi:hypothetical protein